MQRAMLLGRQRLAAVAGTKAGTKGALMGMGMLGSGGATRILKRGAVSIGHPQGTYSRRPHPAFWFSWD